MTHTNTEGLSDEAEQALADRAWWRQAGEALGLELRGWTFRDSALFVDMDTGRSVDLPGSVAERLSRRAANSAGGVEVKALEWLDHTKGEGCPIRRIAQPFPGHVIWIFQAGKSDLWYLSYNTGLNGKFLVKGSEDEAKAAAKADFNRRILSVIVSSPVSAEVTDTPELRGLIAEAQMQCAHPNVHFHYTDGARVMGGLVAALLTALNGGRENG